MKMESPFAKNDVTNEFLVQKHAKTTINLSSSDNVPFYTPRNLLIPPRFPWARFLPILNFKVSPQISLCWFAPPCIEKCWV